MLVETLTDLRILVVPKNPKKGLISNVHAVRSEKIQSPFWSPTTLKYYENWKVREKHVLLSPKCILLHEKQMLARDAKMCMQSATFILEKTV